MPILATNPFGRGVAAALERARVRRTEEDQPRGLAALRDRIQSRAGDEDAGRTPSTPQTASRDELLTRTQQGEDVARAVTAERSDARTNGRGVGVVRTEADDATNRPGDLRTLREAPVFQGRTASARNVTTGRGVSFAGNVRVAGDGAGVARADAAATNTTAGRPTDAIADFGNDRVPSLDAEADARIRLLAANRGAARTAAPAETPAATLSEAETADAFPSAEQISRANTTPEIQQNLREDAGEIAGGLRAEAAAQSAELAERTTRAAEGAQESREDEVVQEGRQQLQELRSEVRELERERAEARREIQDVENDIRQAQGPGAPPRLASTAALATRLEALEV